MVKYYVSPSGDDLNTGNSPALPVKSISKIRTLLSNGTIKRGDSVLFKRGGVYGGTISNAVLASSVANAPLTFGPYGYGAEPVIDCSKIVNGGSWVLDSTNIWKVDLSLANANISYTGNVNSGSVNTGFLRIDGKRYGNKKFSKADLSSQWDFYDEGDAGKYLYVYSPNNPSSVASVIKAAINSGFIALQNSVRVIGLNIIDTGSHAIKSGTGVSDIGIYGNIISGIGGSALSGTTRYGNGVEAWVGSSDWDVRGNTISEVYDTATTMQGTITSTALGWNNVKFRDNTIYNCTQSFETWVELASPDLSASATGMVDCAFEDNICINAGYGWASDYQVGKRVHLLTYNFNAPAKLNVSGNTFYGAKDGYYYRNTGNFKPPVGYTLKNNDVYLPANTKLSPNLPQAIEAYSEWVASLNNDKNSRFYITPNSVNTLSETMKAVTSSNGFARSQVGSTKRGLGRALADARMEPEGSLSATSVSFNPGSNWELAPNYGAPAGELISDIVFLSGAMRVKTGVADITFTAGTVVPVISGLPVPFQPTVRRDIPIWLMANGSNTNRIPGFISLGANGTTINVTSNTTVTMVNGAGIIIFDGSHYRI